MTRCSRLVSFSSSHSVMTINLWFIYPNHTLFSFIRVYPCSESMAFVRYWQPQASLRNRERFSSPSASPDGRPGKGFLFWGFHSNSA
jgi:hypothetical protein